MGLFHYTVVPFCLHGAPATFQKIMDIVLKNCSGFAAAYPDDVFMLRETWEEDLRHLSAVPARIQKADLSLKVNKCAWTHRKYLGYFLGHRQIKSSSGQKVKAIQVVLRSKAKEHVRSF